MPSFASCFTEAGFGPSEEKIEIDEEGGGWDVDDDDLELPPDLDVPSTGADGEEGYFNPPTRGTSQAQVLHSLLLRDWLSPQKNRDFPFPTQVFPPTDAP